MVLMSLIGYVRFPAMKLRIVTEIVKKNILLSSRRMEIISTKKVKTCPSSAVPRFVSVYCHRQTALQSGTCQQWVTSYNAKRHARTGGERLHTAWVLTAGQYNGTVAVDGVTMCYLIYESKGVGWICRYLTQDNTEKINNLTTHTCYNCSL